MRMPAGASASQRKAPEAWDAAQDEDLLRSYAKHVSPGGVVAWIEVRAGVGRSITAAPLSVTPARAINMRETRFSSKGCRHARSNELTVNALPPQERREGRADDL